MKNSVAIKLLLANFLMICPNVLSYPWYFSSHGLDVAHDNKIFGDGIKIAVLDTPVHLDHPSLSDPSISGQSCYQAEKERKAISTHGTAVTSIIGGRKSDQHPDFIGIAPRAIIRTFGVPEKNCGVVILETALLEIKKFRPDIINISSNVLTLSDKRITQLLEELINENPSLIIVVAAGNDGAALGHAGIPCKYGATTQAELEHLANHKFKENFVLVGNLARESDINYGDLILLPNNDPSREQNDLNFSAALYSLSKPIAAQKAAAIIKDYLKSIGDLSSLSAFDAFNTLLLTSKFNVSDDEVLLYGKKYGIFPSDPQIHWKIMMESKINDYENDKERIAREIASATAKRNLERSKLVDGLKKELCREEMTKKIEEIKFVENEQFKTMSDLFIDGLPKNNDQLLTLARDFVPISFDQNVALYPRSARAGALSSIYLAAFGTNIPAATLKFAEEDINKEKPIYTVANHTGTSFSAPVVTGALALVAEACRVSPKEALAKIYKNAHKNNMYWVFGEGNLAIKNIIEQCVLGN